MISNNSSYYYMLRYFFSDIKKYNFQILKCGRINHYLAYKSGRCYTNSNL